MLRTGSNQLDVEITSVNRELGSVSGVKRNKQLGTCTFFSVYFRQDEPVKIDGAYRPHPKLVLAAASAAWRNQPEGNTLPTVDMVPKPC